MWPFAEDEDGILLIEKLDAFRVPDKNKVPTFEQAELVMQALAHFHGSWWKFINSDLQGDYSYRCTFLAALRPVRLILIGNSFSTVDSTHFE